MENKPFVYVACKGFRGLNDRGGIQYLLEAYLSEFSSKDNVLLLIKINPAYGILNLDEIINQLKPKDKNDEELPKIIFDTSTYNYNQMIDFYNKGDVFVSPTRAEAYNLPLIEAMACGLPVITTTFGGQTDYCNEENSWLVGGLLFEVKHEIQYEGIRWLTPDLEDLKKAMRKSFSNSEETKQKGQNALETAKQNTWDIQVKKFLEL
jgi:glycosyltransferase involved in cell wall biosynthesis